MFGRAGFCLALVCLAVLGDDCDYLDDTSEEVGTHLLIIVSLVAYIAVL